jgi:sugar/nucleoside kinase (ribokinase family)
MKMFDIGHLASVGSGAMTALLPPSDRSLDVLCVGNAIVDVLAHTDDFFLEDHGMVKGSMQLTDPDRALAIYAAMPPAVEISGGSAANTAAGLASLGISAAFIGKVADDELGAVFAHDIRAAGVAFHGFAATGADAAAGTARCLICVTPDAQRTMNTSLGVAGQLATDDIDLSLVPTARVVYLEGYLWDEPAAKSALRKIMGWAAEAGTRVAFTLSDGFCVDRHRAEFLELVEHHVDILFANEDEICSLYEVDDFEVAARRVAGHCAIACLTRSEAGSVIITSSGERVDVPAEPAELVDTTGAGDLYAAGFLAGWVRGVDLHTAGRTASVVAAEAISHIGARPQVNLAQLVERSL